MIPFSGTVWRLILEGGDPLTPAAAPEGRFHHGGQKAIYTSLTPEGTGVAIRRYLSEGGPPRVLVSLTLHLDLCVDQRGNAAASVIWQDQRAAGHPASTWQISDAARALGAEAMLYSSRSRPDLTHLVLFADPGESILAVGVPQVWPGLNKDC